MKTEVRIKVANKLGFPDWSEIVEYRDLLYLLVRRDFVAKYKQTVLGPAWYIIQPLMTTLVFTVIFGNVAKIPTNGNPPVLFYMCGLLLWNYFSQSAGGIATTFTANSHIFSKVYFPRLIVPLSQLASNLFAFAIQFATFGLFWMYYKYRGVSVQINPGIWLLLPLLLQTAALALGFGLIISALTARYRDLTHALNFVLQLWMYATPVIYPLSQVPERWRWLVQVNPMAVVVESAKTILLGNGGVAWPGLAVSVAATAVVLVAGLIVFERSERNFVDTV